MSIRDGDALEKRKEGSGQESESRRVGRRVERKLPGRMWHEWKVLLMSIDDIRKVQPNMHR